MKFSHMDIKDLTDHEVKVEAVLFDRLATETSGATSRLCRAVSVALVRAMRVRHRERLMFESDLSFDGGPGDIVREDPAGC